MKASRWFAVKLIPLFCVSGYLLHRHHPVLAKGWWLFGAALLVVGWLFPKWLLPLNALFHWVGKTLRLWMARLILESLYCIVLTPLAWLARRLGKSFLDLNIDSQRTSYFIRRGGKPRSAMEYEKGY
jgi:hypothetical protein